jgi:hypothetical protein
VIHISTGVMVALIIGYWLWSADKAAKEEAANNRRIYEEERRRTQQADLEYKMHCRKEREQEMMQEWKERCDRARDARRW